MKLPKLEHITLKSGGTIDVLCRRNYFLLLDGGSPTLNVKVKLRRAGKGYRLVVEFDGLHPPKTFDLRPLLEPYTVDARCSMWSSRFINVFGLTYEQGIAARQAAADYFAEHLSLVPRERWLEERRKIFGPGKPPDFIDAITT